MTVLMERPHDVDAFTEPRAADVALLNSLELPPGYRAELIEGAIVVTPPPGFNHVAKLVKINRRLVDEDWAASGNLGVITPLGRFIPDLAVAAPEYFERDSDESWQSPEGIVLVIEVTSSDPVHDRDGKRRGYAMAGIPLYLLVDRQHKEVVMFSKPERGDYQGTVRCAPGEPIPLPEPFGFTLTDLV